jgi:hypothetical protein
MESRAGRYIAGLCVSALGLCGGGWLVLTPFAFGYPGRGRAAVTALATGGGLVVVSLLTLLCWALAWRRRLRIDGVLAPRRSRSAQRKTDRSVKRQARAERLVRASRRRELEASPDPAQVLTDLRALLTPLLSAAEESVAVVAPRHQEPDPEPVPEPVPVPVPFAEDHRVVRMEELGVPGHLRGTRSASFLAVPRPAQSEPELANAGSLMRGAELLMVGTGEEESW